MKFLVNLKLISAVLLCLVGLSACDKPGPAESAGKKIDQTIENASEKISDSADKASEKMAEQRDKAGVAIDDAEITTKVKAAIFSETGLKTMQISVDTIKGVVTLSGTVDSLPHSNNAQTRASAVAGVKEVVNHLEIKHKQ